MSDPMTQQFWEEEEDELWQIIAVLYIAAFLAGVEGGIEALPEELRPLVNVDDFNGIAMNYARQYKYTLIDRINDTTRTQSQRTVFEWMQDNTDKIALAALLALIFGDARARMIARTEVTRIYALGNAAAWQAAQGQVKRVKWVTMRDERVCPICGPRDGLVIGANDLSNYPPIHQNCRCWLEPVLERKA